MPTVVASSSKVEIWDAGSVLEKAHGAVAGVRRTENHLDKALSGSPSAPSTGHHPPNATSKPSALASTRSSACCADGRDATGMDRLSRRRRSSQVITITA